MSAVLDHSSEQASKPKLGVSACLMGVEVRFNGGHIRRRRLWRLAEDLLHDPRAAFDGTRRRAVGGDLADGGHRQESATRVLGLIDIDAAEASPFNADDPVMLGQPLAHNVDWRRQ